MILDTFQCVARFDHITGISLDPGLSVGVTVLRGLLQLFLRQDIPALSDPKRNKDTPYYRYASAEPLKGLNYRREDFRAWHGVKSLSRDAKKTYPTAEHGKKNQLKIS